MEEWRSVNNYDGLYLVSNMGRIKTIGHYVLRNNNKTPILVKERILKPMVMNNGYCCVKLTKNKQAKTYLVHRLVAEAFIPNPNNYPCVNHKSEVKTENFVDNLEWCSVNYNNNYGTHNTKVSVSQTNRNDVSKPVSQFTLEGLFIKTFPSMREANRQLNIPTPNISRCCKNVTKTAGGYKWSYA